MTQLDSDHIIKCFDIYENEELKIIVTEYFSEGTLTKKIITNFPLQEDVALDYMRQILKGVSVN
jgi:serine/threonine protein kinase